MHEVTVAAADSGGSYLNQILPRLGLVQLHIFEYQWLTTLVEDCSLNIHFVSLGLLSGNRVYHGSLSRVLSNRWIESNQPLTRRQWGSRPFNADGFPLAFDLLALYLFQWGEAEQQPLDAYAVLELDGDLLVGGGGDALHHHPFAEGRMAYQVTNS